MALGSNNPYPSVLVVEGSAPSSPASGNQRVYIDSADHHLKRKNSSGTVTDLEGGTGAAYVNAHGARVKRASTNFSVGNNVLTAVQWDAEDFDTDTMHDTVTNNSRITIPTISGVTTGLWHITASGYTDASSGAVDCQFKVNNTTAFAFDRFAAIASPTISGFHLSADYVFTAADYVECLVRTTGGSFNVVFDSAGSAEFSVVFLGKVT